MSNKNLYKGFNMKLYKRNQVEEAIARVVDPKAERPPGQIFTRVKRLLDTDRTLGREPRAEDPDEATYAFFSSEPSGSGVEIWFRGYEAFALLLALKMLDHGFPQQKAVEVLRRLRSSLEFHHSRIVSDSTVILSREAARKAAKPGQLAVSTKDPVFAVVTSSQKSGRAADKGPIARTAVLRGEVELMPFIRSALEASTIFEVSSPALHLKDFLSRTRPSQRGRPK